MRGVAELRAFLARILGWSDTHAVELALNSVTLAAAGCTTLVLCGEGDLVPIAWSLHRRVREPGRPFVVPDPRRGDQRASIRSPASRKKAVDALGDVRVEARVDATNDARSGTLCLRLNHPPADLAETVPLLRAADDVLLILCATPYTAGDRLSSPSDYLRENAQSCDSDDDSGMVAGHSSTPLADSLGKLGVWIFGGPFSAWQPMVQWRRRFLRLHL